MSTTRTSMAAAMLCVGLFGANVVSSHECPQGAETASATEPDVVRLEEMSAEDLYKLFHDARLNESDGLGDYVQNFQAN